MNADPGHPGRRRPDAARLWTWAAMAMSIAMCLVMTWLHFDQEDTLYRSRQLLANLREARLDLAKGFLHLSLSGDPRSPFRREMGIALLEQALVTLQKAQADIRAEAAPEDRKLFAAFRSTLAGFRDQLTAYNSRAPAARPELELSLRLSLDELERLAQRVDEAGQNALQALNVRLRTQFALILGALAVLLGTLSIGMHLAGRRQQRAEMALRASERLPRIILDNLPDPAWMKDADGRLLVVNKRWCDFTGVSADQALGRRDADLFPQAAVARFCEEERQLALSGKTLRRDEELPDATGRLRYFETFKAPLTDDTGRAYATMGMARDISDRKAHEREIERLTRLYATISQINQAIVRVKSREELVREVTRIAIEFGGFKLAWVGQHNPQTHEVAPLGYAGEPRELVLALHHSSEASTDHHCLCGPAIRENRACVVNDLAAAPEYQDGPLTLQQAGIRAAAVFPIRVREAVWGAFGVYASEPNVFQDQEIALLDEAAMDIGFAVEHLENEDQRRQAEARVRDGEERLRFALEISGTGAWDLDLVDHTAIRSLEHDRIFGYTELLPEWSYEMFLDHVLPEDRPLVNDAFGRATATGGDWNFECRIRRVDGQIRWIWAAGRHRFDDHGAARRLVGIVQDITARKHTEAALRESESRLRLFVDHAPAALAMFDRDMRYVAASRRWSSDYGLGDQQIIGRSHYEIFPEISETLKAIHRRGLAGEVVRSDKDRFERADGSVQYVRWVMHPWHDSGGGIGGIVIFTEDITARQQAEDALRESEARFRSLVEGAPEAVFVQSGGEFQYANQAAVALLGAARAEDLLGRPFFDRIAPEYHAAVRARIEAQRAIGGSVPAMEQEYLRLDGTRVPVETTAVPIRFRDRESHLVFVRDITTRRKAEAEQANLKAQLLQAQKMESIGRLAGGVAHDFNNLLMGIMGYTEMARKELPSSHPAQALLLEIATAARRSAEITRQLLAFARRQTIAPVILNLNDHVADMLKLLRQLIGEDIDLAWRPGTPRATVKMDPSQVDQILANLAVNARDAIVGVGKLTLHTSEVVLDAAYCAEHAEAAPGAYVLLTVSDTGCGMDAATLEHLFEPFFTTKGLGKGTGLGLATVYGIVKQNHGFINVESHPGRGTTFGIYLPQQTEPAEEIASTAPAARPRGTETLLLVEDEPAVRTITRSLLASLGYTVLAAANPEEALRLAADPPSPIGLLLADVILPGMSGPDLAAQLVQQRPGLRCLYMSGYTADAITHRGVLGAGVDFLQKPFSGDALARKVREILDRPAAPGAPAA